MQIHNLHKLILTLEHTTTTQRSRLEKKDRRFLLQCFAAIDNEQKIRALFGKETQLKDLIKKLESNNSRMKSKCICSFVSTFFNSIANLLRLKTSFYCIEKRIHQTYGKLFDGHTLSPTFKEIISEVLKNPNLTPAKRHCILRTVESFYLLDIYKPFQAEATLQINRAIHVKQTTGLLVQPGEIDTLKNSMREAAQLLINKFEQAKRANLLERFFEEAFNDTDKFFGQRFQRLSVFNPVSPPSPQLQSTTFGEANKDVQDKVTTLVNICQAFREKQAQKYAMKHSLYKNYKNAFQMHASILQNIDFLRNFANNEIFKNYLIQEEKIIGRICSDGPITQAELPRLINQLVRMDLLGVILTQQPNAPKVPILDRLVHPMEKGIKPSDLDQDQIQEINLLYREMCREFENYAQDLHDGPREFNLLPEHLNKRLDHARMTMKVFYQIATHQKELYEFIMSINEVRPCPIVFNLLLHGEWTETEKIELIYSAPFQFFEAYKKHKSKNKLKDLFEALKNATHPCLEGRIGDLYAYLDQNKIDIDLSLLQKSLAIPSVNTEITKLDNIYRWVNFFTNEYQPRKYAQANNIEINENWVEPTGTKHQIKSREDFIKNYKTKSKFIKFLREEVKIVDKVRITCEGTFKEEDIEKFAQQMVTECLLEADPAA